ncbi:hypothetical protein BDR26DRAFT_863663 [Obelidium mucronatum]|nr:hypothetical protein BDR26DRAFT_863663 [Obelidium mucronatum]
MLDGYIPEELGKLETLWTLNLSENRLEGTIPNQVLSNCAMKELLVSKNLLCGVLSEIDVEGWRRLMLEVLDLSGNALQGNIPSWLCDFDDLRILVSGHIR